MAAAFVLAGSAIAEAHDFWVEPVTPVAGPGEPLSLRLLIGHGSDRVEYHRNPKHIRSFQVHGPGGARDVPGTAGGVAGRFTPSRAGLHLVGYASNPSFTQMEPAAFRAYLEEEGLMATLAEVRRAKASKPLVRERYARCAKALVAVGGAHEGTHDRIVGMDLEIVPETNPLELEPGDALAVRVLLRGKPHANARVSAYRRAEPTRLYHARTDDAGRARLPVGDPGAWLIKCVQIERAPRRAAEDWRSLWATLTFERHAKPAKPALSISATR